MRTVKPQLSAHLRAEIRRRTRAAREAIGAMDYVASGMVSSRTKACGRPNCRCATDVTARHGPYFEWHRYRDGRLTHRTVTPEQANLLARAIANRAEVGRLLGAWEVETAREILGAAEDDEG